MNKSGNHREYLIGLYQTRSIVALTAGIGVFICTFSAVAWGLQNDVSGEENLFHYFTVLSNLFAAAGAAFMIPYAVEGIRNKRFVLPKWVVLFQFSGAICVTITLVSTFLFILPTQGFANGLAGMSFWLHLVCPLLTVVLFQCVETGVSISNREMLKTLIPYWAYMAVYFVMVYLVSPDRGGWTDLYMTKEYLTPWINAPMMFLLGLLAALVLRLIQNRRARASRQRITRLWSEDMEPVELKIEAFGLGRYMGNRYRESEVPVPMDIFEMMTERYDIALPELIQAYTKGVMDGMEEKKRC